MNDDDILTSKELARFRGFDSPRVFAPHAEPGVLDMRYESFYATEIRDESTYSQVIVDQGPVDRTVLKSRTPTFLHWASKRLDGRRR